MKARPALVDDPLITLTLEQVGERLQADPKTIRRLCIRGEIRFTKVGKQIRFKPRWVNDYLERSDR